MHGITWSLIAGSDFKVWKQKSVENAVPHSKCWKSLLPFRFHTKDFTITFTLYGVNQIGIFSHGSDLNSASKPWIRLRIADFGMKTEDESLMNYYVSSPWYCLTQVINFRNSPNTSLRCTFINPNSEIRNPQGRLLMDLGWRVGVG